MGFFTKEKDFLGKDDNYDEIDEITTDLGIMNSALNIIRDEYPKKFPKDFKFEGEIKDNGVILVRGNFNIDGEEEYPVEYEENGELYRYVLKITCN